MVSLLWEKGLNKEEEIGKKDLCKFMKEEGEYCKVFYDWLKVHQTFKIKKD